MTPLNNLLNTQEEADVIIIRQLTHVVETSDKFPITIVCDDTDVFILLLYFYKIKSISGEVLLEATSTKRTLISIHNTIQKLERQGFSIEDILPLHALMGCDTGAGLFNIGKLKPLSVLQKNFNIQLTFLGDINNTFEDIYMKDMYIK